MNRREAILGILTLPCIEPIVKSIPKTSVVGIRSTEIPIVLPTKEYIPNNPGLWQQVPRGNYVTLTPELMEKWLKE